MSIKNATNFGENGIALDEGQKVALRALSTRIRAANLSTSAYDTGIQIPARSVVEAVYVNVITAESTAASKLLDIGTSGDADGFLDGVSVAAAGVVKGSLASTGQTLGALLRADEAGTTAFVPEPYVNSAATALTVTAAGNDFASLVADIVVIIKEFSDS